MQLAFPISQVVTRASRQICVFAAIAISVVGCKAPFGSQVSEYKGQKRQFTGAIQNGRVVLTVANNPTKMHNVSLSIDKEVSSLGTEGITIPLSEIKIPSGKLETTSSGGNNSVEVCFLRPDSTLAGGEITCANFQEACEGSTSDVTETEKELYKGTFANGLCQCPTAAGGTTSVGFGDFLAKSKPGLVCRDIALKESKITEEIYGKFKQACESDPISGNFNPETPSKASCTCKADSKTVTITQAMRAVNDNEVVNSASVVQNLIKDCQDRAQQTARLCAELPKFATSTSPDPSGESPSTAATITFKSVGEKDNERCICQKGDKEFPEIQLSLGDLEKHETAEAQEQSKAEVADNCLKAEPKIENSEKAKDDSGTTSEAEDSSSDNTNTAGSGNSDSEDEVVPLNDFPD